MEHGDIHYNDEDDGNDNYIGYKKIMMWWLMAPNYG